ncbi:MAG: hypothetical protein OEV30_03640 [Ignavibacteria bacterium]|nr:hypothetical protein [Ignavibacteria bacterium]
MLCLALIAASLSMPNQAATAQEEEKRDTTALDSTTAAATPAIVEAPAKIIDPELSERGLILFVVLVMLAGFGLLVGLKKREADQRAGLD